MIVYAEQNLKRKRKVNRGNKGRRRKVEIKEEYTEEREKACCSATEVAVNLTKLVPLRVLHTLTFIKRIQFTLFRAAIVNVSSSRW
jgi:hypothetical protein